MRDDLSAPNLGQAKREEYDPPFFWQSYRTIEQWMSRVLSKGPLNVSTLKADEVAIDGDMSVSGDLSVGGEVIINGFPFSPVVVSDTAPTSVGPGALWWKSNEGNLYVYYDDGTSVQWVAASTGPPGPPGPPGPSGAGTFVPLDGSDPMTGPLIIDDGYVQIKNPGDYPGLFVDYSTGFGGYVGITKDLANRYQHYFDDTAYYFKKYNDAGVSVNAFTLTRADGLITVLGDPTAALGIATKQYVDAVSEVVSLAPTASQNNYATGAATAKSVHSIIDIAPTVCMVLTGISTTSWAAGKKVTIRNATSRLGADARAIIIPRNSALSSAANRFQYPGNKRLPLILMPEETADFYFNGTDLKLLQSSRPLNMSGYFDYLFTGMLNFGAWTNGAGAAGSYASVAQDANFDPLTYLNMQTGTTTTGRSAFIDNTDSHRAGQGALLSLSRVWVPLLSTVTEEFTCRVGYSDANAAPLDEICWYYNRNVSTNWVVRTNSNGTPTNTAVTGFAVSVTETPLLGVFVNGDGTRVEFFYSNDYGATWTVFGTAHTTNIPNSNTRQFGFGGGIIKSAGTTTSHFRMMFSGSIGWV